MRTKSESKLQLNTSIKMKLILISLLLLSVPVVVLGTLSYQKSKVTLDDYGATRLTNSVEMTIEMMKALNEQVENGSIPLEEAQERVKVAILGEMQEDGTRPINRHFDLGENGYLFITNSEGMVMAHPSIEGNNSWDNEDTNGTKYVQEYIQKASDGGGYTYYDYPLPGNDNQIEQKIAYSNGFEEWDWVVVASTYLMDFNAPAKEIQNLIIIISSITLVVGIAIIWVFSDMITKPVRAVTERMNLLANGDLSHDLINVKANDEVGQLARSMNDMQENLKEMIKNLFRASETMTSHSEELTQSANEVRAGSEQVASTMQELASGSESQAHHASELSSAMGSFSKMVEEANDKGLAIQQSSGNVLEMTNRGSELMMSSTEQMSTINEIVKNTVGMVKELDGQSQQIGELVSVIKDIADQTNLLALNAAIEAARAGEHGKGFAVVADEVRKLAEEVSHSVSNITGIVNGIQRETAAVTASLQDGYKEVEQGTNQIQTTGETFNDIRSAVTEMINSIQSVTENLSEIAHTSQNMNSSIQEIAAISEESAAGVEQTSASSQQTSSAMEEVSASSNDLANLAEKLNDLVRQFKI